MGAERGSASGGRGTKPVLVGINSQFQTVGDPEFRVNRDQVVSHCLLADKEAIRNLSGCKTGRYQCNHFALSRSEGRDSGRTRVIVGSLSRFRAAGKGL